MTHPTTATEAAAQRERLIQEVHDALGGDGWAYSNYGNNELVDMRDRLEKVVDVFAPLLARAEAADRLAEALEQAQSIMMRYIFETEGQPPRDYLNTTGDIHELLSAYRSLAAQEVER